MELSNEQAQAIADALRAVDYGYVSGEAVEVLERRFPDRDWWALVDAATADPRRRKPPRRVTPAEAQLHAEALDRAIVDYIAQVQAATDRPLAFTPPR